MFKIQTLNTISNSGLDQFPHNLYEIASDFEAPDAILVRSHNMHQMQIPPSVKAIGRAGAGTNNIPVAALTAQGIPVFNTPGANANAVRELVIAGMLLASRNICHAWRYLNELKDDATLNQTIEKNKKQFVGFELMGKTLGIIGLGSIGVKVANAALQLGMNVIGYDPAITVTRAWELSSTVKKAHSIDDLLIESDFISFHVPLTDSTKNMINASRMALLKPNVVILNFARDGIIEHEALHEALQPRKIFSYVTDFPPTSFKDHPNVIALPHLGASTKEAEENCALMIAKQLRDYLEIGSIEHSVNFPQVELTSINGGARLAIVNANIPNMVAQVSACLADAGHNIVSLVNKSREEIAYTVIDLAQPVKDDLIARLTAIDGVKQVRQLRTNKV